jgi:hypothetical protein
MRLLFLLVTLQLAIASELKIVESRRIWDAAPHNAFTDLIRHNDEFLCVFREGQGHVAPDGKIRVISSKDGKEWKSAALIALPNLDLRDPKIVMGPEGQLMIHAAAADCPKTPVTHVSYAWFSKDARVWSDAVQIGETNNWIWRMAWEDGIARAVGYSTSGEHIVRLYESKDGRHFETLVPVLNKEEFPNESALVYDSDKMLFCLLRRDGKPGNGLFGSAKPPYKEWNWRDIGAKIGGPQLIRLPDGRLIGGVRLYDGGARMSIVEINRESGKLTELVKLPSGGDCSYPGLVWHGNELFVSYYSSHEKKTMIYFARLKLNDGDSKGL